MTAPGGLVLIGARTGSSKSSLGFYYNVFLAEKYDLPILHLDAGEMPPDELRFRATCCLSQGRVPLHMVESGQWANHKEYADIIRGDIWPRIRKLKMTYINIGSMSLREVVTLVRRHYYRKVGRDGKHLLINLDYIKGAVPSGRNVQEYQEVGLGMAELKTLITDEILASVWTSVQNNRMGIIGTKQGNAINDSDEVLSLSDRLIQQATMSLVMRQKTPEEMAAERGEFGNIRLTCVKHRRLLGPDYELQLNPAVMPDGSWQRNYFSLESKSFHFTDKGDLRTMLERTGRTTLVTPIRADRGTLL